MKNNSWLIWLSLSFVFLILIVIITFATEKWVILSLGVGFLFGFAIQKGDLCGASAMSEVILMKDGRKLFGIWVAILSSMVFFAIFQLLGVIELAPKKLIWLSAIIGGFIFGIGTVLGGGCISGCMYKGATGNINSIVALLTIPIGISIVDYGPLQSLNKYLLTFVINDYDGKAITLHSILGMPYWVIVLALLLITVFILIFRQKKKEKNKLKNTERFEIRRIFTRSWKPWQAGIVIGVIAILAWLSSLMVGRNYPLGVTHGVNYTYQLLIDNNIKLIFEKPQPVIPTGIAEKQKTSITQDANVKPELQPEPKKLNLWLILLSLGFMIGAFVSGKMSNQVKLLPKEPSQILIAALGGLLIGIGAAIATGCIIGNILSGWAMLSIGMFIFGIITLLSNWATTYFYLIGSSGKIKS